MIALAVLFVLTTLSFDITRAQRVEQFLAISYYNDCEGKDSANYTIVHESSLLCTGTNLTESSTLVQAQSNGQRSVMPLTNLFTSHLPAGALTQVERLMFATNGPLQGKYIYVKTIYTVLAYLKKCSSVLGNTYLTAKSTELLISDKLDMNVLISPTGAYVAFKKGCTTICNGSRFYV